mmetsp:Transcript_52125/g.150225  ORF Transcript_52125/g.150225 Transcript_52125/m.150225 type:complete len:605 (-) Transcript_52125:134-1948(-)
MATVDISEGARELVDLSAESIGTLGEHLRQIGEIIADSTQPPKTGQPRSTAKKVFDKLELYKAYCEDVARRKREIEKKTQEDYERLTAWRKDCGTEGATMVEEMEILYNKVRALKHALEEETRKLEEERERVAGLIAKCQQKDRKMHSLALTVIEKKELLKSEKFIRGGVSSWLQCTIDNIKFKFKADQEKERLRIEHHKKLRAAACKLRLKTIQREQERRVLAKCFLAMQEETIEGRALRHIEEMRKRFEDKILILGARLAQALGDEEKAKQLIEEQVRRMEEEKRKAREAERGMKEAQKDARAARVERDRALRDRDEALAEKAEADRLRAIAERERDEAKEDAADARERAEQYKQAMVKAEQAQRELEDLLRKKNKKIGSLQRMLVELGAESDSDAPPDERPPAFFVNEEGTKIPRSRTRKERMCMAYREAESARWELRLGMAAMVDKEVANRKAMDNLNTELQTSRREVTEVRWAHKVLQEDMQAALDEASRPRPCQHCAERAARPSSARESVFQPSPAPPLAPSSAAAPSWSPARPSFVPAPLDALKSASSSPRLLKKAESTPIIMPPLTGSPVAAPPPERLAPLRKLKRPPLDFRAGWH